MRLILVLLAMPLAYMILVAVNMLPRDVGIFALVFLNSVVWSIHYKLQAQVRQEMNKRTIGAGQRL